MMNVMITISHIFRCLKEGLADKGADSGHRKVSAGGEKERPRPIATATLRKRR
jgi:hypothetical protein